MKAKLQSQNYASGPRSRLSKHRRLVAGLNNNLSVNWTGVPRFLRVIGALAQLYVRIKATLPQSGENFIRWLSESRATAKRESSASTWAMWSTDTNQRLRDGMGRCIIPRTPNVKSELVEGTRVSTEFPNSAASFGHQPELTPTNPIGHWPGVHYGAGGIKIGFPFVKGDRVRRVWRSSSRFMFSPRQQFRVRSGRLSERVCGIPFPHSPTPKLGHWWLRTWRAHSIASTVTVHLSPFQ